MSNTLNLRSYFSGGLATSFARLISNLIQLAIFVLGARLLGPAEFGIFAIVASAAFMAAMLAGGGCKEFILSSRMPKKDVREVLMLAVLLALIVAIITACIAAILYLTFESPNIPLLVALFSIWILVSRYATAQSAILIRDGQLSAVAFSEIIGELIGLVVAIIMLHANFGAAALVCGRIFAQSTQVVICNYITGAFPTYRLTRTVINGFANFSLLILTTRIVGEGRNALTVFLVGAFFSPAGVGFYRAAQRLAGAAQELLSAPAIAVTWSLFRQISDRHDDIDSSEAKADLQKAMEWIVPLLVGIAAPIYIGVSIMSEEILMILLGEAWLPAAPILSILSIAALAFAPIYPSQPLLGVTGNMKYLPRLMLINSIASIGLLLPATQFDLVAVAWAQLAFSIIVLASYIWIQEHIIGIDWKRITRKCSFLVPIVLAMSVVAVLLRGGAIAHGWHPIVSLMVTAAIAASLYIASVAVVRARSLSIMIRALRRV